MKQIVLMQLNMKDYSLDQIREKYLEYKEILEKIQQGDEVTLRNTSIMQYDMMRQIVGELENQGFHLIIRRAN